MLSQYAEPTTKAAADSANVAKAHGADRAQTRIRFARSI